MSSSPKETTTKTEPWDGAQDYLKDVYSQYSDLVAQGSPQTWSGSTVADQSDATKAAQAAQVAYATNPANSAILSNAANTVNGITQGSAVNPAANTALAAGTTYSNAAIPALTNATTSAASANPALAFLQGTASGANVGKNPYLDASVGNATQKIADQLGQVTLPTQNGQAAGLGRLGSNASASLNNTATSAAADAMSKAATDMYANQYNTDTTNSLNAANSYGSLTNADKANQVAAGSALSSASLGQQAAQTDAATALNAGANAQAQTQLAGAGMAADQYTNGLLPSTVLGQVGAAQDTRAQDTLNQQIALFDQDQQKSLTNLSNFANVLNGGGYSNSTTPVYSNTGGQLLGGLAAVLGALPSDERIKHVGIFKGFLKNGLATYEWTYKDDPEQRVYVGPMAQDVEEIMPDAVIEIAGVKHIVMDRFMEAA